MKSFYRHRPIWAILETEKRKFTPRIIPDNICRADVVDGLPFDVEKESGGIDMFGVEWVYVPVAGGSMEREDVPHLMDDANDWREAIVFPDVDSWDWEGCARDCNSFLAPDKYNQPWIFTGWFERLISFMGFEDAAVALIDEDQQDAVAELFMAISDVYIDIVDHFVGYFDNIDGFYIHDDWGSQAAPFFSCDAAADLIVPAMRKVTDHIHELGLECELHSCGCNQKQIENIIAAGWDAWAPQLMNDLDALFEEYGDQINIATRIPAYADDASDEEQRAAAREWVAKYCTSPGKVAWPHLLDGALLKPAFREELYVQSRKAYAQW